MKPIQTANQPSRESSWVTIATAARITGQTIEAIAAIVASGALDTKADVTHGHVDTLVDRKQITSFFAELAPAF